MEVVLVPTDTLALIVALRRRCSAPLTISLDTFQHQVRFAYGELLRWRCKQHSAHSHTPEIVQLCRMKPQRAKQL